jgi:hypothetical protein
VLVGKDYRLADDDVDILDRVAIPRKNVVPETSIVVTRPFLKESRPVDDDAVVARNVPNLAVAHVYYK